MKVFFNYYKKTYLNKRYSIIDWNMYHNVDINRTNNIVERYVRYLSDDFKKKPSYYNFLKEIITDEANVCKRMDRYKQGIDTKKRRKTENCILNEKVKELKTYLEENSDEDFDEVDYCYNFVNYLSQRFINYVDIEDDEDA